MRRAPRRAWYPPTRWIGKSLITKIALPCSLSRDPTSASTTGCACRAIRTPTRRSCTVRCASSTPRAATRSSSKRGPSRRSGRRCATGCCGPAGRSRPSVRLEWAMQDEAGFRRKRRIVLIAGVAALLALFAWLFDLLVQPALPRSVAMSTGPVDGAYHAFAQQYRAHLARYGVDLVLKPSSGSVENLERLRTRREGVQIALVQGGLATGAEAPGIMTLGSLFYEPVWLFYRERQSARYISDLRGRHIAIGAPGSGVRALAVRLLKANGVDESNAQLDTSGGLNAAERLESGALDTAVFVNAPEAPAIQRLLRAKGVQLANIVRADAYVRQLPFLQKVVLPAGVLDLAQNVQAQDQVLMAATANQIG